MKQVLESIKNKILNQEKFDETQNVKDLEVQKMRIKNITELKSQIEQKEYLRRIKGENMNKNEAEINLTSTVPMDFIMPSDGVIGGIPGIGISHDRKRFVQIYLILNRSYMLLCTILVIWVLVNA